jgi:hypothetical protein
MIREVLTALLIALFISIINFKLLWHLIWPKWKAYGKFIVYITITIIGTYFIGKLIYIYILGYPFLGLLIHIFWCKKHGMDWKNIDKEKFIDSQKKFYGYGNKK